MLFWTRGHYGVGLALEHMDPGLWALGLWCLALGVAGSVAMAGLWLRLSERGARLATVVGLGLLAVVIGLAGWKGRRPDLDEMEHLHAAWLMSQGRLPYVDFWQHHAPPLWLLLAPVLGAMRPSPAVMDFGRLLSLAVSACAILFAVLIARRLHTTRAVTALALVLCLGAVVPTELYNLRPDLLANPLCLAAVLALMRPWGVGVSVGSGILLGLAAACHLRSGFMLAALPVAVLTDIRRPGRGLGLTAAHLIGVGLGALPLFLWLQAHGLWEPYVQWVVRFNGSMDSRPGGTLPLLPLALVVAWAVRLRADRWGELDERQRLLLGALGLGIVQYWAMVNVKFIYHQQLILLLAAAAGAEEARRLCARLLATRRPAVVGALLSVLLLPTVFAADDWLAGMYEGGRRELAALQAIAGGEPVVTVPPGHPIFAADATDLSQPWQFNWWLTRPEIRARLQGLPGQIMRARPVLVVEYVIGPIVGAPLESLFVNRLIAAGITTQQEGLRLEGFLRKNYNLVGMGTHRFWVRRDRPVPPEMRIVRPAGPQTGDRAAVEARG